MSTIIVKVRKSDQHSAPAKLADAEIHFAGGELDDLRLVGFAVGDRQRKTLRRVLVDLADLDAFIQSRRRQGGVSVR